MYSVQAIDDAFGLTAVSVGTLQSLSGRGDAMYPAELVQGNIYPVWGTKEGTEKCIQAEVASLVGLGGQALSVRAHRVGVHIGHFIGAPRHFGTHSHAVIMAVSSTDPPHAPSTLQTCACACATPTPPPTSRRSTPHLNHSRHSRPSLGTCRRCRRSRSRRLERWARRGLGRITPSSAGRSGQRQNE